MTPSFAEPALRPLFVDLACYFGGAEIRVLKLAQAFAPHGGRVACLAGSPLARRLDEQGLSPLVLQGGKTDPRLAASLARAALTGGYTLVDTHNLQSYVWTLAALAGRRDRPALTATLHSSPRREYRNPFKRCGYDKIERLCLPHFDRIITVSRFLQAEAWGWGVAAGRISVSPNGAPARLAQPARETARRELGLSPEDAVVGAVGRLEPAKGHRYLLEAMAQLSQRWPRLRCVLVGDGRLSGKLKQLAARLGLGERVIFTGFRSDVMRLVEAFDVFALPSLTEGIPFALLEACAGARPIVASRVGGVPEVIEDGRSGCLIAPASPTELATAIGNLLMDPCGAQRLGQTAAQDVERRFSMSAMVSTACEAYDAALRRDGEALR